MALGVGGLPRGRVVEIYGPESSGKTTLALQITAACQAQGGICAFVDAEHALDVKYAKNLGENMKTLDDCRVAIDSIDDKMLELLNKRMQIVERVGEIKNDTGGAIYRPEREKAIIDRLDALSIKQTGYLNKQAIEAIFLEIFAVSRNLELPEKVAFLGPLGTYTHQLAESRFGATSSYLPISSINGVFREVYKKQAKYGVIPIENSSNGIVSDTITSLQKYDLKIISNFSISVSKNSSLVFLIVPPFNGSTPILLTIIILSKHSLSKHPISI